MKLINFSVGNFRSFLGEQHFRPNYSDSHVNAIFGPNASGKTNLLFALFYCIRFIRSSTKYNENIMSDIDSIFSYFQLSNKTKETPTTFSLELEINNDIYKYAFAILKKEIVSERLSWRSPRNRDELVTIFSRSSILKKDADGKYRYQEFGYTPELLKTTRSDALLLTRAWETNNKYAVNFFAGLEGFRFISGAPISQLTATRIAESDEFRQKVLQLLTAADLSIRDINAAHEFSDGKIVGDEITKIVNYPIYTSHYVRDDFGKVVNIKTVPMDLFESNGTKKIFALAYPVLTALEYGQVLYIDEFESSLHPQECQLIINLFASPETNPLGALLIINTHQTQIINWIKRDDIFLLGKNNLEATIIGKIPTDVRKDDKNIEGKYNRGWLGAVPNIGSMG